MIRKKLRTPHYQKKDHDLHLRSDTLLLTDIFENFRKRSLAICELDPAKFLLAPGLAWEAALKKDNKVKLGLLLILTC